MFCFSEIAGGDTDIDQRKKENPKVLRQSFVNRKQALWDGNHFKSLGQKNKITVGAIPIKEDQSELRRWMMDN